MNYYANKRIYIIEIESVTATESSKWKERVTQKADSSKALGKLWIILINILGKLRKLGISQKSGEDIADKAANSKFLFERE